ncbi:MAG: transcriptional regulator, TetR family, partial [Bryobacterales bacterium]|nr:transcriptional regulator, TetR family [Bryobacterales bacterium]
MAAEDRRRQLIETAIDLFSQKGFAGTTTREIAAAAGVTEAIIFRHFATKQDLYAAILDTHSVTCDEAWLGEAQSLMDADNDQALF